MKLTDLKKYRRRTRQLAEVEAELRRQSVTVAVEGSRGAPGFELTTRQVEGYPHTERVCQLMSQRRWLREFLRQAEDFIFGIEDERVCEALILYCMDERIYSEVAARRQPRSDTPARVTWEDVALKMDEPSGAAIKMAVMRYFSKTAQ